MLPSSYLHDMKVKQVVNKFLKEYAEKKDVYPGDEPTDRIRDVKYAHMVRTIYATCKQQRHAAMGRGYNNEPNDIDNEKKLSPSFNIQLEEFAAHRKLSHDKDFEKVILKLDKFLQELLKIAYKAGYERNPDNLIGV